MMHWSMMGGGVKSVFVGVAYGMHSGSMANFDRRVAAHVGRSDGHESKDGIGYDMIIGRDLLN